MSVYDFDNTIYDGDSSIDFWFFSLTRNPIIVVLLPYQIIMATLYKCKVVEKAKFKEVFLVSLR